MGLKATMPVASAAMPEWLARQPPTLGDPYTLRPMAWDAARRSLVFDGRQPNTQNPEPRRVYRVVWGASPG